MGKHDSENYRKATKREELLRKKAVELRMKQQTARSTACKEQIDLQVTLLHAKIAVERAKQKLIASRH